MLSIAATMLGVAAKASADVEGGVRPMCSLSTSVLPLLESDRHRIGVAVIELNSGMEWRGGDQGPFALHSVVKAPIAWLALIGLSNGETNQEAAARLRRQIGLMVTHSANEPVAPLLRYIGGLSTLGEYYESLGVPEMAAGLHPHRWGVGTAAPLAVARLYAALAVSPMTPESVRREGFGLLARVPKYLRWGAARPPETLAGWQSLVKTGWFLWEGTEMRINSAAIWLDADEEPQYVVVMMLSGKTDDSQAQTLQNRIGRMIGGALAERANGDQAEHWNCLNLPLDRLVARYY